MRTLVPGCVAFAAIFVCLPVLTGELAAAEAQPQISPASPRLLNRTDAPALDKPALDKPTVLAPAATPPVAATPAVTAAPVVQAPIQATAPSTTAPAAAAVPVTPAGDAGPEKAIAKTVAPPPKPQTSVVISVSLTDQHMTVTENGAPKYTWPISSGRSGYVTPTGTFRPQWMARLWHSRKYDNAPMPHAIFFTGGFAIHATYATGMLGRPASHGCVRLSPANAATLYKLVQSHGMDRTKIVLHGAPPRSAPEVARREARRDPRLAAARTTGHPQQVRYAQAQPSSSPFAKLFGGDDTPRRVTYVQQQPRSGRPVYAYTQDGRVVRIR